MKHWVGYRAEIKNEIAALEKKMKCGPSICGMGGIQIRQRRIRGPQAHTQKKRVWISPYTLFPSTLVAKGNQGCAGRAAFGVPLALTRE